MGNSRRFRMFHVMPNVWFYKLRDFGRFRESEGRLQRSNSIRDDPGIRFGTNQKTSEEHKSKIEKSSKGERRKCESSTFIDSRISVGCSCTTTLAFIWNSTERDDHTSTESSDEEEEEEEEEKPVSFYSRKPTVVLQQQEDTSRGYMERQGLPSPVQEFDDEQQDQQPVTTVKEMFELVGNPLVMDAASCGGRFGSSSQLDHNAMLSHEQVSFLNINSQDHCSALIMEMDKKKRCSQGFLMEEDRPTNAELKSRIIEAKQKQISKRPIREKVDTGNRFQASSSTMNFSKSQEVDVQQRPKKPGKSSSRLSIKTDQNNRRVSTSKLNDGDDINRETTVKQRGDSGEKSRVFDSFVEVKSSYNPHMDFRESMLEMITEKDIHGSFDLEKLVECYLSLNSHEYHDIIMQAFEQVTSELKGISS